MLITIFSHCYGQNDGAAEDGPPLADFWDRDNAQNFCPSDCVVIARRVTEDYALANCED